MNYFLLIIYSMLQLNQSDLPVQRYATLSNYVYAGKPEIGTLINGKYDQVKIVEGKELFVWKQQRLSLTAAGIRQLKTGKPALVKLSFMRDDQAEEKNFTIILDAFHKNQVVAHRGAWKQLGTTENSITALVQAVRLGCAGSEFDVQMTADDSLVINHDAHYADKTIEEHSFATLAATSLSNGEPFPTLRNYLQAGLKQTGTKLVVEIKPTSKGKDRAFLRAQKVVELVHELGAQAWVSYISFDYDILLAIKQLDPSASLQYLNGEKSPEQLQAAGIDGLDYHFSVFQKNENWIRDAQQRGMITNVWTVNNEEQMRYFLNKKFDLITTNEPELLFQLLKSSPSASK